MSTPPQCWYAEPIGFNRTQQCFLEEGHAGDHDCGLSPREAKRGFYYIGVALILSCAIGHCSAPTASPAKQISCNPCASKAMDAMLDCMAPRMFLATAPEWERYHRRAGNCLGVYELDVADCVDDNDV